MNRRLCMTALLVMSGWQLTGLRAASADFERLLKNSPFGVPAPPPPVAPVQQLATLELRGVLKEGNEFLFSIHDKSARSSRWVGLKESGLPYAVERYDSRTGQAVVSQRGKLYTLALLSPRAPAAYLAGVDPMRPIPRDEGPWSAEAVAATWRGDLEGDYLKQLQSPVEINEATQ